MFSGFYNGVNGIKTQNFGIDISANNIANINTPGFKYSSAEFEDIFYQRASSQSTNPAQSGFGGTGSASKVVFEQGSFMTSDGEFDVALNGKGFFGVLGANNQAYYTRNGSFSRDGNGNLVDSFGNYVLGTMNPNFSQMSFSDRVSSLMGTNLGSGAVTSGWTINNVNQDFSIGATTTQSILSVPKNLYLPPEVTTSVSFKGSLNAETKTQSVKVELNTNNINIATNDEGKIVASGSVNRADIFSAKAGERVILNFKDANGVTSSIEAILDENLNYQTNAVDLAGLDRDSLYIDSAVLATEQESADNKTLEADVYNSDGSRSTLRYTLSRVLPQVGENIEYSISAGVYNSNGELVGGLSNGNLVFNQNGALIANSLTSVPNPNGGTISVNLGTPLNANVGSGYDGVYINKNSNSNDELVVRSNGFAEGFFSQYDISKDGSLVAQFTNGRTAVVGKLALYNFINEQGLASAGSNNFMQTSNSGAPTFIYDQNGNFNYTASFVGGKLEQSNADLSMELTNLIVMQKAFDASSKSITTSDEMIQRAINMKN
ncbi:flagellar hook protein FlgE [Campylobacter sp. MIT 19-121]|uniref:flagellar hook-basal body complex protein n=1 Tax=Campylobacter sp. MIT 19-121 TaxID=2703906 RepID=UPI001389B3EB|nr:flagellar hook-basal body complex protein [Campylobacter sp. MIT 19-121]NDJ27330.1 flagellar hook protein FlgE [Campylobacter sp. MIT 19-121]